MISRTDDPAFDGDVRRRIQNQLTPATPTDPGATPSPSPTFPSPVARPAQPANPSQPYNPSGPSAPGQVGTTGTAPIAPIGSAAASINNQLANNPAYLPTGTGYTYKGYNPQSGAITGTPPVNVPTTPAPVAGGQYSDTAFQAALRALPANGDSVRQVIAQHPEWGLSALNQKGDKVRLPDGRVMDVGFSFGDPTHADWQWLDTANQGAGGAAVGGASNPFLDSIRSVLMARLQQDQQPVSEGDPSIAAPLDAARLEAARGQEAERRDLAERLFASHDLNSNSLTQGIQQSAERNAVGLAGIRSSLIAKEYQARRADLAQNLQLAIASGDAQMAREVQMQLSQLDAQLRREGYGVTLAINAADQNRSTVNAGLNG